MGIELQTLTKKIDIWWTQRHTMHQNANLLMNGNEVELSTAEWLFPGEYAPLKEPIILCHEL